MISKKKKNNYPLLLTIFALKFTSNIILPHNFHFIPEINTPVVEWKPPFQIGSTWFPTNLKISHKEIEAYRKIRLTKKKAENERKLS